MSATQKLSHTSFIPAPVPVHSPGLQRRLETASDGEARDSHRSTRRVSGASPSFSSSSSLHSTATVVGLSHYPSNDPFHSLELGKAAAASLDAELDDAAGSLHSALGGGDDVTETLLGSDSLQQDGSIKAQQNGHAAVGGSAAADVSLPCFCLDLARLSPDLRFIVLTIGVSVFFLANSWVEEYTFKQLPAFKFGWYLTFFELLCFSVFAVLERQFISFEPILSHTAPLSRHLIVAAAMTASRGLTNVSLQYLNYPTQIIFKSMKLITVMIGSLLLLRASFTLYEYASAVALVVAACAFSLGDTDVSVELPWKGISIVLLSLVGDSLHSNTQDSLLRQHSASTSEAMLFTNFFAAVASLVYIVITGELFDAIAYCQAYPQAYVLFIVRSAVIYLGVLCFMLLIKSFGVVAATSVTTVRKIVSILTSFVLFPKPWSNKYWWGGLLFALSLGLSVMDQRQKRAAKAVEEQTARRSNGGAAPDRR